MWTDEKLTTLHVRVTAELAEAEARREELKHAVAEAELAKAAAQERFADLCRRVAAAVGDRAMATPLRALLEIEKDAVSQVAGARALAQGQLENLDFHIADLRDALRQVDTALAPPAPAIGRSATTERPAESAKEFEPIIIGGLAIGRAAAPSATVKIR